MAFWRSEYSNCEGFSFPSADCYQNLHFGFEYQIFCLDRFLWLFLCANILFILVHLIFKPNCWSLFLILFGARLYCSTSWPNVADQNFIWRCWITLDLFCRKSFLIISANWRGWNITFSVRVIPVKFLLFSSLKFIQFTVLVAFLYSLQKSIAQTIGVFSFALSE